MIEHTLDTEEIVEIDEQLQQFITECNTQEYIHVWCSMLKSFPTLAAYCTCWGKLNKSHRFQDMIDAHPELYVYVITSI